MTDNNRKQAMIPDGAQIIRNPVGTAPAFAVEYQGHLIISLPGVPHEMKYLMQNAVLPLLRERLHLHGTIKSRILHTCGLGESAIGAQITDLMQLENPTVGTAAHPGQTDVRITVKADSDQQANELIEPVEQALRARLSHWIYGADGETLPGIVLGLLAQRHATLATIETACAGQLAAWLGQAPAASGVYRGGLYLIQGQGGTRSGPLADLTLSAESSQDEADAAAQRMRGTFGSDYALAVTGIAEYAANDQSPAYLALAAPEGIVHSVPRRGRTGAYGRGWLLHYALDLVRRHLLDLPLE